MKRNCFITMRISSINQQYYTNQYQRNYYNSSVNQPAFKGFKQIKRGVLEFKKALYDKRLDKNSEASQFFGSTSLKNVQKQLYNHLQLALLKSRHKNVIPSLNGKSYVNIDNPDWVLAFQKDLIRDNSIQNLFEKGAARVNLHCHFFGTRKHQGAHAIGIVVNKEDKKLYILDSLPKGYKTVKKYQKQLHSIFTEELAKTTQQGEKPYEIIISSKYQEVWPGMNGYTCDNWTHANIDAVQDALKKGTKITTQKELNAVLPDDINEILEEQQSFVNSFASKDYFFRHK